MVEGIPLSCSLRVFAAVPAALTMSPLVTYVHASLRQTLKSIFSSTILFLRMWCTLCAMASTDPFLLIYLWCEVCPILLFVLEFLVWLYSVIHT